MQARKRVESCGEGIQRERAQKVAAHAALDLAKPFRGALQPGKIGRFGHFLQFAQNICIPNQLRRPGLQKHHVFEHGISRAKKTVDFGAPVRSGAVGFGRLEQFECDRTGTAAAEGRHEDKRVAPGGDIGFKIER